MKDDIIIHTREEWSAIQISQNFEWNEALGIVLHMEYPNRPAESDEAAKGDEVWYKPGNGKSNAIGRRRAGIHRTIAAMFVVSLLCMSSFTLGKDKDKDEANEERVE